MKHSTLFILALCALGTQTVTPSSEHHTETAAGLKKDIDRIKTLIAQLREKIDDDYDVTSQNIDGEALRTKEEHLKKLEAQYECLTGSRN